MKLISLTALVMTGVCRSAFVSVEHEVVDVPDGWAVSGPSNPEAKVELTFAVKQQNLEELHDTLMRVSDPRSASYGEHLSNAEVQKLTAPKVEHSRIVMDFLKKHGADGKLATPNGDMIKATVPFSMAEKMLSARYTNLVHSTGAKVDRILSGYLLPEEVAAAIDFVSPAAHIPGVRQPSAKHNLTSTLGSSLNQPKTLRQLYNINAEGKAAANKQAVTAFVGQFYSEADLKEFWGQYCTGINCGKGLPKLVGDATTGIAGTESMLDIEYITGVGGNIETEFWGFGGDSPDNPQNEPFMKFLAQVSSTSDADVPKLFSTSYGEPESSWSNAAADRLNAEFMKVGARGITLLFASGDTGAGCKSACQTCLFSAKNASCQSACKYQPNMPATSPYVTAVGGTQPTSAFPQPGSEEAIGLSSGGFSNYWATPSWQKDATAAYIKTKPTSSDKYNASGRGFPDISAQATNFCVTVRAQGMQNAGTSCASPTAAGIFGLLNDLRLQNGKATLGFLNPMLYQNADAFYDVTAGSSYAGWCSPGWPAAKGWDAVTGLGTPNYQNLAKVVSTLPGPAPVWERKPQSGTVVV